MLENWSSRDVERDPAGFKRAQQQEQLDELRDALQSKRAKAGGR